MSNKKDNTEENPNHMLIKEFKSLDKDPGVAYVENFYKRKIQTLKQENIYSALLNAAEKGSQDPKVSHLMYVRDFIKNDLRLLLKLTKEQRHAIFVKASQIDKEKLEDKMQKKDTPLLNALQTPPPSENKPNNSNA